MTSASAPAYGAPDPKYAHLAPDAQVDHAAKQLREHGFEVVVVADGAEAQREVLSRLPPGSEVLDETSRTLEETGILEALSERSDISLLKPKLRAMDRSKQGDEIRRRSQAPGVALGSVHAITEDGQVLVASATGGQLGPYAFGAARVIWVAGTQKIVPRLADGLDRLEHYALPLEDARARVAYGVGSALNRILIFRTEDQPGRTTLILVKQKLGF